MQAVNCGQSEDVAAGVRSALKGAAAGSPRVVLVCASAQPEHSAANLKVELAQLAAVQQAVAEQASEALFIYTAQAPQQVSAQRRSMLTYKGFGPYQVCGPLCKVRGATDRDPSVCWATGRERQQVTLMRGAGSWRCGRQADQPWRAIH